MKITIHRGINQIGGCITEIATSKTRIFIDLGQNLPNNKGVYNDKLATPEKIAKLTAGIDAIFYTHNHSDHIGLFHLVPDGVKQYIGGVAKLVTLRKHIQLGLITKNKELSNRDIGKLKAMTTYEPEEMVQIGDIRITPYFVSHSACDSYMFLIEADGKRILHTGDFRDHGYLGKGLIPTIEKRILPKGGIDILITEGTLLSRQGENAKSEPELQKDVVEIMRQYKNVFVLCSSTDMERLATFYAANRNIGSRPFVCDEFQKDILSIFTDTKGDKSPLFRFEKVYDFHPSNRKLVDWMIEEGFCMLVRAGENSNRFEVYAKYLLPLLDSEKTVLIYSMWGEYINPQGYHENRVHLDFISLFPTVKHLHTSGHASMRCLARVCATTNPRLGIIPIHSEQANAYRNLPVTEELKSKVIVQTCSIEGIDIEIIQ